MVTSTKNNATNADRCGYLTAMQESITTLTFCKYTGLRRKIWAFGMMQYAHAHLAKVPGIRFYKLLGSGKGKGFNPLPDWSTYAVLIVWENEKAANDFFAAAKLARLYEEKTTEMWTLYLRHLTAKGAWSGQNPFAESKNVSPENPLLAVVTRATIKPKLLYAFWKYVPTSHRRLHDNPGLIFTKGVGEVPIIQMATFSLWRDKESLMSFAYGEKEHRKAVEQTRKLDWYSEEMFARFQPYRSVGTWGGSDPLQEMLDVRR